MLTPAVDAVLLPDVQIEPVVTVVVDTAVAPSDGGVEDPRNRYAFPREEFSAKVGPEGQAAVRALVNNNQGAVPFLINDPTEPEAVDQPLVVFTEGGGCRAPLIITYETRHFATNDLVRSITRDVFFVADDIEVKVDGVVVDGWTVDEDGVLHHDTDFYGQDVTWSGTFYKPVRLKDDQVDFLAHAPDGPFSVQQLRLISVVVERTEDEGS